MFIKRKGHNKLQLFSDSKSNENNILVFTKTLLRKETTLECTYRTSVLAALPFVVESFIKYQRLPPIFNFKGTGCRTVSNTAQFHHVTQV